jgi:hypothetical protein
MRDRCWLVLADGDDADGRGAGRAVEVAGTA